MRRLYLLYQVFHSKVPKYIHIFFHPSEHPQVTSYFQNTFLPCVIKEWNKLDPDKRSCLSYNSFCKALLNFIRPSENKIYKIHDQVGIKLLTRLRLEFTQLRVRKFWHNVEDILIPLCSGSIEAERTLQFFVRCQVFQWYLGNPYEWLNEINISLPSMSQGKLINVLLYGSDAFDNKTN